MTGVGRFSTYGLVANLPQSWSPPSRPPRDSGTNERQELGDAGQAGAAVDRALEEGAALAEVVGACTRETRPHLVVGKAAERLVGRFARPVLQRRRHARAAASEIALSPSTRIERDPAAHFGIGEQARRQRRALDVVARRARGASAYGALNFA